MPADDLLPVIKPARGLIFPSLAEGFGLPVIEAFAAQVPVITSNTTSLPEVAGDAALMIDPHDVEAISQAMTRLIADDALVSELKVKGLARAKTFTWDACSNRTLDVYREVLGR